MTTIKERELIKILVSESMVRRFSIKETQAYIKSKMDISLVDRQILKYKKWIKQESLEWLNNMAKSRDEFIAEYRQRILECESVQKELWALYYRSYDNPIVQAKCLSEIAKVSDQIADFMDALPVVHSLTGHALNNQNRQDQVQQTEFTTTEESDKFFKEESAGF